MDIVGYRQTLTDSKLDGQKFEGVECPQKKNREQTGIYMPRNQQLSTVVRGIE